MKNWMMSVLVTEKGMPRSLSQPSWKGTSSALSPPSTLAISGFITSAGGAGASAGRPPITTARKHTMLSAQHLCPARHPQAPALAGRRSSHLNRRAVRCALPRQHSQTPDPLVKQLLPDPAGPQQSHLSAHGARPTQAPWPHRQVQKQKGQRPCSMGEQHRPPSFLHWGGQAACDKSRFKRIGVSTEECAHWEARRSPRSKSPTAHCG